MGESYIKKEKTESKRYGEGSTYISKSVNATFGDSTNQYFPLPEEYDVFTKIDSNLFTRNDTEQFVLISKCLQYMREQLVQFVLLQKVEKVLPKLTFSQDVDGTITFNWVHSNFRAFFSFEGESGNYDAYCGIVVQAAEDSVSTQTRKLTQENCKSVVEIITKVVCENS